MAMYFQGAALGMLDSLFPWVHELTLFPCVTAHVLDPGGKIVGFEWK